MGKGEAIVRVDISKYKFVDLPASDVEEFVEALRSALGRDSKDFKEVLRFVRNFDDFYEYSKKKFKDYIALPHKPSDYIRGAVVIDKIKLYKDSDGKPRVVFVINRSIDLDPIRKALEEVGYKVSIKKEV